MKAPANHLLETNDITLHYIEYAQEQAKTLVCLHGVTANAHAFDGLVAKGLNENYRVVAPDLRGRGLSSHPAFGYSMEEHAKDIIGLLDHLHIQKAFLVGHSFGGYLSFYLAANYPDRVEKLVILDAALEMNPDIIEMLAPAMGRLDKKYDSWDTYLKERKAAPYMTFWSDDMLSYLKADVMKTEEGGVTPRANIANIVQCSLGVSAEPWEVFIPQITQPTLLLNAMDAYTLGQPLLPEYKAKETVEMMKDCQYGAIDGNHQTMMYETGATEIVNAIQAFVG